MINKAQLDTSGFSILNDVFSSADIENILSAIHSTDQSKDTFRRSADLFAIRQFLKEVPGVHNSIFTEKFRSLIKSLPADDLFVVKSIYFDKSEHSNWFVSYHQDLTISVDKKTELSGYGPWTVKQQQFAVQPPLDVLESIYTIRIHLDDTDEHNGALKVIPGSHRKGIYRPETIDWTREQEQVCCVPKGGVMLMRPLLLHSSGRSTNNRQRRVIHLELSNAPLAKGLSWAEKEEC